MTSQSFRTDCGPVPSNFRTPSPPPYELFDSRSPATSTWSASWATPAEQRKQSPRRGGKAQHNGTRGRKRKSAARGKKEHAMDDFAAIALLANGENGRDATILPSGQDTDWPQRPSKRAKSEHIASIDASHLYERPHTSYHTQRSVETADAELLLNFSRIASSEATCAQRANLRVITSPAINTAATTREDEDVQYARPNEIHTGMHPPERVRLLRDGSAPVREERGSPATLKPGNEPHVPASRTPVASGAVDLIKDGHMEGETDSATKSASGGEAQVRKLDATPPALGFDPIKSKQLETENPKLLEGLEAAARGGQSSNGVESPLSIGAATADLPSTKANQKSPSICAGCNFHRNSLGLEPENGADSWISCDGCKSWFHFACAGFKSEREVRSVDRFRCRQCKSIHGPTTYVRKSSRTHSAIDYAGLHEGIVKTSDESPLHHYIKPIKDGTIKFDPECFPRVRPELITRDFFEKGDGMKEPIIIPALFNPRPRQVPDLDSVSIKSEGGPILEDVDIHDTTVLDDWHGDDFEFEQVPDNGQDALDMVIPAGLNVRKVAELYGPDEKIDVIDVKSQNGEDKKWTMRRWADYYESQGENKKVRNVISLEVSQSKLGALIQRPKIVRDLDLQDSVWPAELSAKGDYPKVQFYCLMSVADCYTDFHIDFGGSSVYYHILEGKKTFFFIPPYEKHLKKYEEWCNSPAQNWTFLGDQTKECYRVDLFAGDTMLIPAGWIHAVWTPADSLVIGGNFLTRLNLPMQIRVTQIEKATFVDRKFRYPAFQKVMWYTALRYLENDPIPDSVVETLVSGQPFKRDVPTYLDFDGWGGNSASGPENYHLRYYPRSELDGMPELARYVHRTALIAMGSITEGITTKTQEAVRRSIPKGIGDALQTAKKFAIWYTWKRGNETIPHWAYPDYVPEVANPEHAEKKISAKTMKKLDREAALQASKIAPDRQSARVRSQPQSLLAELSIKQGPPEIQIRTSPASDPNQADTKVSESSLPAGSPVTETTPSKKLRAIPGSRRSACEPCRKGRRACKHRDGQGNHADDVILDISTGLASSQAGTAADCANPVPIDGSSPSHPQMKGNFLRMEHTEIVQQDGNIGGYISRLADSSESTSTAILKASGRSKACKDCRKSKRRCVHDEHGNEDPVKVAEAAVPRPAAKKRKSQSDSTDGHLSKSPRLAQTPPASGVPGGDVSLSIEGHGPGLSTNHETSPTQQQHFSLTESGASASANTAQTRYNDMHTTQEQHDSALITPLSDAKYTQKLGQDSQAGKGSESGPGASSLVSPPESTHTDVEGTPPTALHAAAVTPSGKSSAAAFTAMSLKLAPRFTPESNAHGQTSTDGDATSPTLGSEAASSAKPRASRPGSDQTADEESLRLIRQLAAQDMGLRRRAKVL